MTWSMDVGNPGEAIDGVQIYYTTPAGETYSQAYYRSQTTASITGYNFLR